QSQPQRVDALSRNRNPRERDLGRPRNADSVRGHRAPYIDGQRLANALSIPGVTFAPIRFTPDASVFAGNECGGVRIAITDRKALRPVAMGVKIATVIYRLYPNDFEIDKLPRLLRDPATLDAIRNGTAADWRDDEAAFNARRSKYLLYR